MLLIVVCTLEKWKIPKNEAGIKIRALNLEEMKEVIRNNICV